MCFSLKPENSKFRGFAFKAEKCKNHFLIYNFFTAEHICDKNIQNGL